MRLPLQTRHLGQWHASNRLALTRHRCNCALRSVSIVGANLYRTNWYYLTLGKVLCGTVCSLERNTW